MNSTKIVHLNADNFSGKNTQFKLIFKDSCEIEQLADGHILIKDMGEVLNFTDRDKPQFKCEVGKNVIEYSGLATDKNLERSWAKAIYRVGGLPLLHFHAEMTVDYYITSVKAQARVIVDDQVYDLTRGDHIQILPGQVQKVINLSPENELSLFVKCTPSWSIQDHHILEDVIH